MKPPMLADVTICPTDNHDENPWHSVEAFVKRARTVWAIEEQLTAKTLAARLDAEAYFPHGWTDRAEVQLTTFMLWLSGQPKRPFAVETSPDGETIFADGWLAVACGLEPEGAVRDE